MIPSVDDSTIHLYLGTRQERLREKKMIQNVERQELGLKPESDVAFKERQQQQQTTQTDLLLYEAQNHDQLRTRQHNEQYEHGQRAQSQSHRVA